MEGRRIVPVAVMAVGVALATAIAIPFATGSVADFADLVPAPDEIVWAEGEQTTLWLSTNRHAVDVEIGNIALGLGDIEERTQGQEEPTILGVGPGCLDLVVASLTVEHDTGSQWSLSGTIERGPNTTGDVEVHVRYYRPADQMPEDGLRRSTSPYPPDRMNTLSTSCRAPESGECRSLPMSTIRPPSPGRWTSTRRLPPAAAQSRMRRCSTCSRTPAWG